MGDDEQVSLYQIWDNTNWYRGTLTNSNPKYTQIALFLTNTKPKNQRFTNTKYEYQISNANCAPKREPQSKSKSCNVPKESKSPNCRTKQLQTSLTIPNCNPQISKNQTKENLFFLTPTHSIFTLFNCRNTLLI